MEFQTLIDVFERTQFISEKGVTFIDKRDEEVFVSYDKVYDSARRVLGFLQDKGLQKGSEVVFQLEDNLTFVPCFWACILGGMIPVPLTAGQQEEHKQKVFIVWENLDQPYFLSNNAAAQRLQVHATQTEANHLYDRMANRMLDAAEALSWPLRGQPADVQSEDLAFIQFSSGSTGKPKGVQLTHANLLSNLRAISNAAAYVDSDAMMSWMPLTHDMGLIGFHINAVFVGIQHYLISVNLFIRYPAIWLSKASKHKATVLCSPNFGYEYTLKYCAGKERRDWNLSAVRIIYNGAEPISARLCAAFTEWLKTYELKAEALRPVYGLAEATLAVAMSQPGELYDFVNVDRQQLNVGFKVIAAGRSESTVSLVGVGRPVKDCRLRIANDTDDENEEGIVGNIQVKGKNVTSGYCHNPEGTASAFTSEGWFRTGDIGFLLNGILYVTGRKKDIIFFHGQNYYSSDLESIAWDIDGIEANKIVITGFFDSETEREKVLAFLLYRDKLANFSKLASRVRETISRKTGLYIDKVLPVKSIPRTTSGKLQRFALAEDYRNGAFAEVEAGLEHSDFATGEITNHQKRLLGIWNTVFGPGKIRIDESFYEAGGNSLKMGMLQMLVLKEFGVELSAETLLKNQTVRDLAAALETLKEKAYEPITAASGAINNSDGDLFPLSAAQRRLYYVCTAAGDSTAYNIPVAIHLKGNIDEARLGQRFRELSIRHEALRTSFHMYDEPRATVTSEIENILTIAEVAPEKINDRLLSGVRPFDLSRAPLIRATLIHTGQKTHVLFIDIHHIISDGVSMHALIAELFALYNGIALRPLSLQYRDYVQWEQMSVSTRAKKDEPYWSAELKDLPVLDLPTDFQRPPVFNSAGGHLDLDIPKELSEGLRQLAGKQQVSLHVLLLSAYFTLLSKYTGFNGVVIGIAVAGRNHPDLQDLQGIFVKNLPIRVHPHESWTLPQLLIHTSHKVAGALAHQDLPFEKMVRVAGEKQRDMSRNKLFDTMFLFQNMGFPSITSASYTADPFFFDTRSAKYDLSMEAFDDGGNLRLRLEYATAIFRREAMQALISQYRILLESMLLNPQGLLRELRLDTKEDSKFWLESFNATGKDYRLDVPVQRLFEQQAISNPEKIALECGEQSLSYVALDRNASRFARLLKQKGIGPNAIVGILLERKPELVIAILAVLKSGGCYLPLDTSWPGERLTQLLTSSRSQCLITSQDLSECLQNCPCELLFWEDCVAEPDDDAGKVPSTISHDGDPSDLAYVIYTSGTTGQPKGVMISHRALTSYCCCAAEQYIKEENVAFPLHTSVAFDLTVTSIFLPLITGNRIVIYPEDDQQILLEKIIAEDKVDIVKLTPAHLRIIRESRNLINGDSRIRRFIVGGEALPVNLAADIYARFGNNVEIFNEYGPTEATVGCMIQLYEPGSTGLNVPIGIPSGNVQIYLLDEHLQPVATGILGEMYISGESLATGYLFNEELTRQKFIDNPFRKGSRMYKTGDVGRRSPEGLLSFKGRADRQVKINGYRVEPEEIEICLRKCESIKDALVTVVHDQDGQRKLYAYYTADKTAFVSNTYLRDYLSDKLPVYMIPSRFIQMEAIPLTVHGKIDFHALPAPLVSSREKADTTSAKAEMDQVERSLVSVWETILGTKGIQATDNFFEIGGDSIKAVQISARLFDVGISIQAKDILRYPSIRQLKNASVISTTESDQQRSSISAQPLEGSRALIPIESWFFSQKFHCEGYYNQSVLLEFEEDISIAALEKSFSAIIRHHDGLRSNYDRPTNTIFYNNDHYLNEFKIAFHDAAQDSEIAKLLPLIKDGFDIADSLLLKAALIGQGGRRRLLFITAHHLVMDGVSWRILLEDLYVLYQLFVSEENTPVLRKTTSTREWQGKLSQWLTTHNIAKLAAYWKEMEDTNFSIRLDEQPRQWLIRDQEVLRASADVDTTRFLLRQANEAYKTDTGILLTTVLALTLRQWTGLSQVKVELEGHGRELTDQDISRTIGWFTSLYPLKINFPNDDIGESIQRIKELMRKMEWRGAEYGLLKYAGLLSKKESPDISAVRFNYLGQFGSELRNDLFKMSWLSTGKESHPENGMTAQLEIIARVVDEQLQLEFYYNRLSHYPATINFVKTLFLENTVKLTDHIRSQKQTILSPSDFDAVDLDNGQLSALFS